MHQGRAPGTAARVFHPLGYWINGDATYKYQGIFNGNNKTIDGLYVNRSSNGSGLFEVTYGATIQILISLT